MRKQYNHNDLRYIALQALSAIESRVKEAMLNHSEIQSSKKRLKKCKITLDTCAIQLKAFEMLGIENFEQYHKVCKMLAKAKVINKGFLDRKKIKGSHET